MRLTAAALTALFCACQTPPPPPVDCPATMTEKMEAQKEEKLPTLTVADAQAFVKEVEEELLRLWIAQERAAWVKNTYITHDTEVMAAAADEAVMAYIAEKSAEAVKFDALDLPEDVRRKLHLLKVSLSLPAPQDADKRGELAQIATFMESTYGKGSYCPPGQANDRCLNLGELSEGLAKERDYDKLLQYWQGWRTISVPMRTKFQRYVELANLGAQELGFANLGDLWKSRYDMEPAAFEAEVDRLWQQVKPLYDDLHCYTRAKLQKRYGKDKVADGAPIPAHLLGNMWSQEWSNLFDLLAPEKRRAASLDKALKAKKVDEKEMVRYGERFFVSLGLDPLPKTFWERSMFTKPQDRDVVCHASAWDVDYVQDLRIKMCININAEDFSTIHHELGHNYYQYYYRHQPTLFRDSANHGFHEAMGDTISLSVTPSYLKEVGLLKKAPDQALNQLMERALAKVAFLPFGLVVDKWRWGVFSGKIPPEKYNRGWWDLRTRYQGVAPPLERSEEAFDPGAKYHIPANVPYTRYFLATILQFQFHRAVCQAAGHQGPLHTCSIYGNKEVGKRLAKMMAMGLSRPWPEALKVLTGETEMDASAILSYFEPLHAWLKKQNKGQTCGW